MSYQYEAEAYQQLSHINYLYLGYAWSPRGNFFPDHRAGIEFFQRLPKGFEGSLGMRLIYWDDPTWVYTGSISWLHNKNYLAFRPFFCRVNSEWFPSYNLAYRRYFSDREEYAYAMLGYGVYSEDFMQLYSVPPQSYMMQIGILKFITVRWFFLASAGYAYDSYGAYSKGFRNRFQAQAGVRYYFNMFK